MQASHQTYYIHRTFSASKFLTHKTLSINGNRDLIFLHKRGMKIRTLPESWPPRDTLHRRQSLEYIRKVHRRLQSWHRRLARAQLRTKQRLWFCELPDSPDSSFYAPSSNERDEDRTTSIMEPSRIETISVPKLSQTSWSQTNQSWDCHSHYYGWVHAQDLWDPSATIGDGYHNGSNLLVSFAVVNLFFSNMSKRAREARHKSQLIALH